AIPLAARFGEAIMLEGYSAPEGPVQPGTAVPITLYWRALAPIEEQWSVAVKLFGRDEHLLAESASYPDAGRWPTRGWPQDVLIADRRTLLMPQDVSTPALGQVEVDLFRLSDLHWLPVTVEEQPVRPFRPFSLVLRSTEPAPPAGFLLRPLVEQVGVANGVLEVQYAWQVGQQPSVSYQTFLHLATDATQSPVAQQDFAPLAGSFPSPYWLPGDHLLDQATLLLPTGEEPGNYLVLLGLYDLETKQRVVGEDGTMAWTIARLHWDGSQWQVVTTDEG
ncbi:MAG: hypothetical protein H0T73_05455, partial [Ardenticatenales bacterium]|nr:hypothetical protein [Ardenticatenales bacterium]